MRAATALLALLLPATLLMTAGCSGFPSGAPAGNDALGDNDDAGSPAAKVESFLPTSLTLDIDELPEDGDNETAKLRMAAGPGFNIYEAVIRVSATIVHRFHRLADRCLALGAAVRNDMDDPNQTQVEGSYRVWGFEIAYKADFAAFDIDGDGTTDGSGNAIDLPVALRMWTDQGDGYQRFLCALITQKPSQENLGSGQMYMDPEQGDPVLPEGVQIYVDYDRTDPAHKWNEAHVQGRVHPLYGIAFGAARVDVRTNADGDVEKTVRGAHDFTESPYGFHTFQSALHYMFGGDGLLMSAEAVRDDTEVSITNVCISRETWRQATEGECDGFDAQDMDFLELPTGGTANFPADFPEEPTF